jgi:hypothetical protein
VPGEGSTRTTRRLTTRVRHATIASVGRFLTVGALVALCALLFGPSEVAAGRVVDLDEPGALEALQRSNPTHHEKVQKILADLPRQPERAVPRWMQTSFDARDVSYRPVLLTSNPPKRRLSFALDDTRYEILLTVDTIRGVVVPLK